MPLLPLHLQLPPSRVKLRSFLFYQNKTMFAVIHCSPPDRGQLVFYLSPLLGSTEKPTKFAYVPLRFAESTRFPELLGIFIDPGHRHKQSSSVLLTLLSCFIVKYMEALSLDPANSLDAAHPYAIQTCKIRKPLVSRVLHKNGWVSNPNASGSLIKIVPAGTGAETLTVASTNARLFSHKTLAHQNITLVPYSKGEHGHLPGEASEVKRAVRRRMRRLWVWDSAQI